MRLVVGSDQLNVYDNIVLVTCIVSLPATPVGDQTNVTSDMEVKLDQIAYRNESPFTNAMNTLLVQSWPHTPAGMQLMNSLSDQYH